MPRGYYQPGPERASRVADLFAQIAPRYDLMNDLQSLGLHRWWKRRMLQAASIQRFDRVLDVCCGTGDLAFRQAAMGARVVGLDFSDAMLQQAVRRGLVDRRSDEPGEKEDDRPRPCWVRGDALALPFGDEVFDVVTIAYGLRNLSNYDQGVAELWRVLRPRGRLVVMDFSRPKNRVLRASYFWFLGAVVPTLGRWFGGSREAYAYILDSLRDYPSEDRLVAGLERLGAIDVSIDRVFLGAMSIVRATRARVS